MESIDALRVSRRSAAFDRSVSASARVHVAISAALGHALLLEHEVKNPYGADCTVQVCVSLYYLYLIVCVCVCVVCFVELQ